MLQRTLRILIPGFLQNLKDTIYLKGYYSCSDQTVVVYFVEYSYVKWEYSGNQQNVIYGIWTLPAKEKNLDFFKNFIVFNYLSHAPIKKITINSRPVDFTNNCIVMLYEYDKIKNTEIKFKSNEELVYLQSLIQKHLDKMDTYEESYKPVFVPPFWLSYSMFGQHVSNYFNLAHWFFTSAWRDKKISIKQGNLILAVLVDILLGYLVLQFVMINEKELSDMLMGALENLVNSLYTLLKWLMGAPAGLKLNNAFNKMLGKYFSYHIQLWWLFLEVTGEKLEIILQLFHFIGYVGITFQAAIISDMLCIATFHSYCIYVYAARLFNIQVSGLIALLRLFVGRKYNPLRGGIDSCEYTNQELFVGTVAFTILLLLMPTTAMYYAVFTLFRLLSLILQHTLAKLIYSMHTLSIYVVGLWVTNSSKVAGKYLLFNIQVSGLIALLRLFVGRKYNPLRGGIDSCEYTNQELFVGTVAFTILLLLMPTTAMYYAVFTLFRLLSLILQHTLAKLIYSMHTLSIYVVGLWVTNSSKVAGNILLEVISNEDSKPMVLKLKLLKKPLHDLVKNFTPPVEVPKQIEWTNLFSNVLMGNQII